MKRIHLLFFTRCVEQQKPIQILRVSIPIAWLHHVASNKLVKGHISGERLPPQTAWLWCRLHYRGRSGSLSWPGLRFSSRFEDSGIRARWAWIHSSFLHRIEVISRYIQYLASCQLILRLVVRGLL